MNRKKYINGSGLFSVCGEIVVRGQRVQIAQRYEYLANEASRAGDERLYHIYLNHAEHYRKQGEQV